MKISFKNKIKNTLIILVIFLTLSYSVVITFLFLNKHSKSSSEYDDQTKEIVAQFGSNKISVRVSNQIDNYAVIEEHSIPVGGGGWGVVKKVNGKWQELFMSQYIVLCSLYSQYKLPPGLIGDCVND